MNTTIKKALGLVLLIVGTFLFVYFAHILLSLMLGPDITVLKTIVAPSISELFSNILWKALAGVIISLVMMFLGGMLLFSNRATS